MSFFPSDFLEKVQAEADIVSVISGYIPLKPSGRNFKAVCPFHNEKTPSFMVSPEKQIYHCFGCGVGGGVINFVKDYERVDFAEAVKILANKTGLPLPEFKKEPGQVSKDRILYSINEAAVEYYQRKLVSPEGKKALDYLKQRGLSGVLIEKFKLGYALPGWEELLGYLVTKGFKHDDIERAGLILSGRSGKYYDRFRGRVIFPIFDIRARVVGFGGRGLDPKDESGAKYINSPQTEIFDKGRILYGLDKAKAEVAKTGQVVIVEGYMDLLACFRAGVANSAATLGTALTPWHLKTLARYARTIVMIYDSDKAGQSAALRGLDLVLEHDLEVRLVNLPAGGDPDSFLAEFGRQALAGKIQEAQNLFDYKISLLRQRYDLSSVEDRALVAGEMLPTISKINNQVLRSGYVRKLAEALSVNEDAVLAELRKIEPGRRTDAYLEQKVKAPEMLSPVEENIIALLLGNPEVVPEIKNSVSADDFSNTAARLIISKLFELSAKGKEPTSTRLMAAIGDEGVGQIVARLLLSRPPSADGVDKRKELMACLDNFNKKKALAQLGKLKEEIKRAADVDDQKQLNQLLEKYQRLSRSVKKS